MKRILITLALPLAVALVAFTQNGCQPGPEPAANNAPAVARETPPDVATITAELTRIENDWPRVVKERDGEAVKKVHADDYFGVVPDGSVTTKEQDIKDMVAGNLTAESMEVTDIKVTVLNADAAVVSGRTILTGGKYKMSDGKSVAVPGQIRFVDTFARRNGEWKLVASAAVPVLNPPAASPTPTPKASPAVTAATPAAKAATPAVRATTPVPPPAPRTTP